MDLSRYGRLQVTLFIPEPVASRLDEIRRMWDPTMAARIRPHITMLRSVPDPNATLAAMSDCDRTGPCSVSLRGVRRAEPAHGAGVFVHVVDPAGDLARLTAVLTESVGQNHDAAQTHPHVTLVHPRTVAPEQVAAAWDHLRREDVEYDIVLDQITLIGETDRGWMPITCYQLAHMD
jgi:2'-5' RNA ligase